LPFLSFVERRREKPPEETHQNRDLPNYGGHRGQEGRDRCGAGSAEGRIAAVGLGVDLQRPIHPPHQLPNLRRLQPPGNDHQVPLLIHDNEVAAEAGGVVDVLGHARPVARAGAVEPPHIAVVGVGGGGLLDHLDPFFGDQLLAGPLALAGEEQAHPGLVQGIDEYATAVMTAATNGLHLRTVQRKPGVVVAEPTPGGGGADGVHDALLQHLRQWLTPDLEQGVSQEVDPHVVVFKVGAGLVKLAVAPVVEAGFAVGAVGPVVEAEEGARPVGSLEQQVLPGDLCVVVAAEGTVPDVVFDGFVDVADQAVVEGKASGGREVAFGDTESALRPAVAGARWSHSVGEGKYWAVRAAEPRAKSRNSAWSFMA